MNDINTKRTNSAMMRKQKSAKYLTAPTRPVQIDRDLLPGVEPIRAHVGRRKSRFLVGSAHI